MTFSIIVVVLAVNVSASPQYYDYGRPVLDYGGVRTARLKARVPKRMMKGTIIYNIPHTVAPSCQ